MEVSNTPFWKDDQVEKKQNLKTRNLKVSHVVVDDQLRTTKAKEEEWWIFEFITKTFCCCYANFVDHKKKLFLN